LQRLDGEIITANRQVAASTVREQLAARHVDELGRQRDAAADQVRALALARYVDGGQSGIERVADVLRGRDTSEFSREAALEQVTVDSAQQHYTSASRAYRSAVRERDTTRRQLQGATTERDQIVEERTRTETALQSSQGQIDSLRQQVNLGALVQSNGGSIGSLLAAREAGQLPPPIGPWFAWPLAVMHPGSPFGFRTDPVHGWTAFHAGVDFPQPTGTPIRAPANGTVVIAGPESGYGNCTVIDHGNALATLYGHQSAIIVRPGDEVKRGEVIGYVGSTGKSTGPHLHFEVRVLGKPVNPLPWLDPAISG
jgi:murein DD-endopeptidase MepM/ murein hydrolase activator NlpD